MTQFRRVALTGSILALASTAQAQSMNVRVITDNVMTEICGPFLRNPDMRAAQGAAERLGYAVTEPEPLGLNIGAAQAQPPPLALTLARQHHGTVRISLRSDRGLCSVGMEEASVRTVAETAAPHLRALGLSPVVEDLAGRPALSVWRGAGMQAVIAASPHHRPGVELVLETSRPAGAN